MSCCRHSGNMIPTGLLPVLLLLALVFQFSCTDSGGERKRADPEVVVLEISTRTVPIEVELSGRVSAFRKAEVRPQVSGILQSRLFEEGTLVQEGQSLYKIDPSLYEAAVDSAKAALASAEARLTAAKLRRTRRARLLSERASSRQEFEDADAEFLQARAAVDEARAALRTAEINLRYTDVLAPITGRVGKSSVTQGALVTANQDSALATIQQFDPVYVDITQSVLDQLRLRERRTSGALVGEGSAEVTLLLESGQEYATKGLLKFSDVTVDESTGMVLLRAVFPNPESVLLPGMYVRARVGVGTNDHALLVPQTAIQRDPKGVALLWLLKEDSTVEHRIVRVGDRVGSNWVVDEGVADGDRVVVEGFRQLRPGLKAAVVGVQTTDDIWQPKP